MAMFEKRVPVSPPSLREVRRPVRLSHKAKDRAGVIAFLACTPAAIVDAMNVGGVPDVVEDPGAVTIVSHGVRRVVNLPDEDRKNFHQAAYVSYRYGAMIHDIGERDRVRLGSVRGVTHSAVGLACAREFGIPDVFIGIRFLLPNLPSYFFEYWAEFFAYSGLYAANMRSAKLAVYSVESMAAALTKEIDLAFLDNPDFPYDR